MKCAVCGKVSKKALCARHALACKKLIKGFSEWQKAMDIDWFAYLSQIIAKEETGEWVKQVVQYFLKHKLDIKQAKELLESLQ